MERENQAEGHVDGPQEEEEEEEEEEEKEEEEEEEEEEKKDSDACRCNLCALFDLYHEMPDENTDEKKYKEWHDKARIFLTQNNIIPASPVEITKTLPN